MTARRAILLLPLVALACGRAHSNSKDSDAGAPDAAPPDAGDGGPDSDAGDAGQPPLEYFDGGVLTTPTGVNLYWGDFWNTPAGQSEASVCDDLARHIDSIPWFGLFAEYPQRDGAFATRFSLDDSVVLTAVPSKNPIDDSDVQTVLSSWLPGWLATHHYSPQEIYFVFLPPDMVINDGTGSTSADFCGYHAHFDMQLGDGADAGTAATLHYVIVVHDGNTNQGGCLSTHVRLVHTPAIDSITATQSHEMAESMTDPDDYGWTVKHGDDWDEVADPCWDGFVGDATAEDGGQWVVQKLWSNHWNRCVASPAGD